MCILQSLWSRPLKNIYPPFDVVHDFLLEVRLPLIGGHVEGHLGLDDDLTDVLDTGALRWGCGQIDQLVNLGTKDATELQNQPSRTLAM